MRKKSGYLKEVIRKNKKTVISAIVLIVMIGLTVIALLRGQDIGDIFDAMAKADIKYIILAVLCVPVFVFMQAICIRISLYALRQQTTMFRCTLYAFTGFFYCLITPFQAAGPPIQMVYMKKEKIPYSVSAIVLFIISFMFKLVLVAVGFGVIIFGQDLIKGPLKGSLGFFGVGLFLTAGFCFVLLMIIFKSDLMRRFFKFLLRKLEEKHILKHKEGRFESLDAGMDRYKETAGYFLDHKILMLVIFLLSCVQRFILFFATYFVYRALGLYGTDAWTITILQAVIPLCVDMIPIPGGMGLTELLFTRVFAGIFTGATLFPGLILSRGITYYVQLIVCGLFAVFTHLYFRRLERGQDSTK